MKWALRWGLGKDGLGGYLVLQRVRREDEFRGVVAMYALDGGIVGRGGFRDWGSS